MNSTDLMCPKWDCTIDSLPVASTTPLQLCGSGSAAALFHLGVLWRIADAGLIHLLTTIESENHFARTSVLSAFQHLSCHDNGVATQFALCIARPFRRSLPKWPRVWMASDPVIVRTSMNGSKTVFGSDFKIQVFDRQPLANADTQPAVSESVWAASITALLDCRKRLTEIQRDYLIDLGYVMCDAALQCHAVILVSKKATVSPNRLFYASFSWPMPECRFEAQEIESSRAIAVELISVSSGQPTEAA